MDCSAGINAEGLKNKSKDTANRKKHRRNEDTVPSYCIAEEKFNEPDQLERIKSQIRFFMDHLLGGAYQFTLSNSIHIEYLNDMICSMTGYTKEEILHTLDGNYTRLLVPEDISTYVDAVLELAEYPHVKTISYRFKRKDGRSLPVTDTMQSVQADSGKRYAFAMVVRDGNPDDVDIEDEMLIDLMPGGVAIYSCQNDRMHLEYCNNRQCELAEVEREQYIQMKKEDVVSFIAASDRGRWMEEMNTLVAGDKTQVEYVYQGKNKNLRKWMKFSARVLDRTDEKVRIITITLDVTKEINSERENRRILQIASSNPKMTILKYQIQEQLIETSNPDIKKFLEDHCLHRMPEDILQSDLTDSEGKQKLRHLIKAIRAGKKTGEVEFELRINNRLRWYRLSFHNAFDENGQPTYAVVLCQDVDDSHEKELRVMHYNRMMHFDDKEKKFYVQYDLTTGLPIHQGGTIPPTVLSPIRFSYADYLEHVSQNCMPSSSRWQYKHAFHKDHLLEEYQNGTERGATGFQMQLWDDDVQWTAVTYQMITDPYSNHVCVLFIYCDIEKEKNNEIELQTMVQRDPVTELLRGEAFMERVNDRLETLDQSLSSVLGVVEIEGIETAVAKMGKTMGDTLLHEKAVTLKVVMQKEDILGRTGRAEFAFLVSELKDFITLREKLKILLTAVYQELNAEVRVRASVGVAVCPQDGGTFQELYDKARSAQSKSKRNGGNQIRFYENDIEVIHAGNLDYHAAAEKSNHPKVTVRAFGYFDVFVNGNAIAFPHAKTKEMLALLVDRRGGYLQTREIIGCLWEEEPANETTMSRCRKIYKRLKDTLESYGIADILESKNGSRRIVAEKIDCDYYRYLTGKEEYKQLFKGDYLMNYTWAETTLSNLLFNQE